MKQPFVLLISACVATTGFVGWRLHAIRGERVNHFAVVQDPSRSFRGGCASLLGSAEAVLHSPGVSKNSTLAVLALGDDSTAREPRWLGAYPIPTSRKVIEGKRAKAERQQALLQDLWRRCESLRPASVSPIFLGVKQAIAELRAEGCGEGSQCGLWVSTDLEENAVRAIEARIDGAHQEKIPLPELLDNGGITVTFCGFAETTGGSVAPSRHGIRAAAPRDPRRDDRLVETWRMLFTKPGLVTFSHYCPEPSPVAAQAGSRAPRGQR
jgi:hypothetical protein